MVIKSKAKKLKLEFKNIQTDLLKINKNISNLYQKKDYLNLEELRDEINDLMESSEIKIINEHEGYDGCFITSAGIENKVNRPAFIDKYGNCLVQGYREVSKKRLESSE
jgi:hypothetical protein